MARASKEPDQIKAVLKWEESNRQWVATGQAVGANGVKRLSAPGLSTTKALHRLSVMFEEVHVGPFELIPDVHVPPAKQEDFNNFVKRLKVWKTEGAWIVKKRLELAITFVKDHHMPTRTVAPMLGMSPARLGKLLTDFEMGVKPTRGVGRPPKDMQDDTDEDEE